MPSSMLAWQLSSLTRVGQRVRSGTSTGDDAAPPSTNVTSQSIALTPDGHHGRFGTISDVDPVASVIARLPLSEYMIREPSLVQPRTPRTDSCGSGWAPVPSTFTTQARSTLQRGCNGRWQSLIGSLTVYATRRAGPCGVAGGVGSVLEVAVGAAVGPIEADVFGGTRAGRLTGPDPITSAPASSATSTAAAARRTINGRPEERRERKTGRLTAVTVATRPRSAARAPMVSHRSGVETSSRVANRRRRSSIALSQ